MLINDCPAEKHLVMKAMRLMRYDDFEIFAIALEWFRTKGRTDSRAKVTTKVVREAINAIENNLDFNQPT